MNFILEAEGPVITSISPNSGINTDTVSTTITGSNFQAGATIKLIKAGQPDIIGIETTFVDSTKITTKFDLEGKEVSMWDVVVINSDEKTFILTEGFAIVDLVIPFDSWEEFTTKAGVLLERIVNVSPDIDDLFILLKKSTHIGYDSTWSGSLRLLKEGQEISFVSGSGDFNIHIQNPEPGWYTLEIVSDYSGREGIVKACADLDTLLLGEWKIGEILRPYGCDWLQLDVPEGQDSLFFQTEGFGLWSTLDIYHGFLGNKDKHWKAGGHHGYHIEYEIKNPPAGRYYLRYMDSAVMQGAGGQTREYMIFADVEPVVEPPPSKPIITELSTYKGGTAGPVTVIISGRGLDGSTIVSLIRDGYADVVATSVSGDTTQRELIATFDLSGAEPGEWTLKVTNPDGQDATAPSPFIVESGGEPQLWVEIVGREQIRIGRPTTFIIRFGNQGNVNVDYPYLLITLPSNVKYEIGGGVITLPPDDDPPVSNPDVVRIIVLGVPALPSNSIRSIILKLTVSTIGKWEITANITSDLNIIYASELSFAKSLFEDLVGKSGNVTSQAAIKTKSLEKDTSKTPPADYIMLWTTDRYYHAAKSLGDGEFIEMMPSENTNHPERPNSDINVKNLKDDPYHGWTYHGAYRPSGTPKSRDILKGYEEKIREKYGIDPGEPIKGYYKNPWCFSEYVKDEKMITNCVGLVLALNYDNITIERMVEILRENVPNVPQIRAIDRTDANTECLEKIGKDMMKKMFESISSITPEDKYGPTGYDLLSTPMDSLSRFVPEGREFSTASTSGTRKMPLHQPRRYL